MKRILWTPRWRTSEGNCHFFDYKDYFIDFCSKHPDVDFAFRPHPLCFQNFLRTKEMSLDQLRQMEKVYEQSSNMRIDLDGDYQDTFLTADVLVADVSSLMVEFLATGKPIIYTHRVDAFNEVGKKLAGALYWVRNVDELDKTLSSLIKGVDSMKKKRLEVMKSILFLPPEGAGVRIKETLKLDFAQCGLS